MPRALLAGAFGQGNLGDEALLESFIQALPDWRIVATSPDAATRLLHDCDTVRPQRPGAIARELRRSDAVIVGGGTLFKTLHPMTRRRPMALLANASALVGAASLARRPVALVGVGAGGGETRAARQLSRSVVRHADLLILRDEDSATELSAAGVPGPFRVGAGPAWTLLNPSEESGGTGADRVLVVPSGMAAGDEGSDGLLADLAAIVRALRRAGAEVRLQPWQSAPADPTDDVALTRRLARELGDPTEVLAPPCSLQSAVASMRGLGAVLTYRFHALVAAGAAAVPSVAVAHEHKLAALARPLGQRQVLPGAAPGAVAAAVLGALEGSAPARWVVHEEVARAEAGFRLLRVFLGGGALEESDTLGTLPLVPWVS